MIRLLLSLSLLAAVAGCAAIDRDASADALARQGKMARMLVKTDPFLLTAFVRITDRGQPVTVYVEGDGLAWLSRSEPSRDPTPREAQALALAAADPSANVVYLARPCQFTERAKNPACTQAYWTGKRFAPEVVASIGQALDQVMAQLPGQKLNLVGYSGGGAVVVLAAARRTDVASIRTVAGNLDIDEASRLQGVSPLTGSLNPIAVAGQVAKIPQIHFSGGADPVISPSLSQRFAAAAGSSCVRTEVIANASHDKGWTAVWPDLLARPLGC